MARVCFVLTAFLLFILEAASVKPTVKYEVLLDNMTDCAYPQPPFTDKRVVIFEFKINKVNGKTYLSGKNTVLEEVPFLNYSTRTYSVGPSGKRELVMRLEKRNCRSFMGKTFLICSNFRYNAKNCHMLKGITTYKDFDLDKLSHRVPNWHLEGNMVYQVSLVADERTVFCLDLMVTVKTIN